jgi:erythromycin esterase-like protein
MKHAAKGIFVSTLFIAIQPTFAAQAPAPNLPENFFPLAGVEENLPHKDLEPLEAIIGGAQVIGFGEEAPGSGGISQMKVRLIKYLVEHQGFRNVAMEVPWNTALPAEKYVDSCQGDERSAVNSLMYAQVRDQSVAKLLTWMCQFNQRHPTDKVRFYGVDEEEPYRYGPILNDYLSAHSHDMNGLIRSNVDSCVGANSSIENFFRTYNAITSGTSPVLESDNQTCVNGLLQTWELVKSEQNATPSEINNVRLALIGLNSFQESMYQWQSEKRYQARARGIADLLLERFQRDPGNQRTIFWTAGFHASATPFANYKPTGAWLTEKLGTNYFPMGFGAYQLQQWPVQYTYEFPTEANSIDIFLHRFGEPYLLVDLQSPLAPSSFSLRGMGPLEPGKQFRAFVFLNFSPPIVPAY